ncbi:MAG: hypothetical protein ACI82S_000431 [Patiriisocius sp.]|jgi:hypothetical protein
MHKYYNYLTLFSLLSFLLVCQAIANEALYLTVEKGNEANIDKNYDKIAYEYCGQLGWLNNNYCYLKYGVDVAAITINDWFKGVDEDNITPASTKGRLRFGWEPRSTDFSEVDFRFKIRVKLPALEDRVELLFSDEEDDVSQQAVKAARSSELGSRDQAVLALQFKNQTNDRISYRIGFGRGSQLYTRARFADQYKFTEQSTLRYFAETNYYSGDKLGFEANAEYGFVIDSSSAFEVSNSFRFRNNSSAWLWRHELQFLRLGENDSSYLFSASVEGTSKPSYREDQMLVSLRYKRKVLREWLFIEIEPFVLWLRDEDFKASVGIAIRTEIHFST